MPGARKHNTTRERERECERSGSASGSARSGSEAEAEAGAHLATIIVAFLLTCKTYKNRYENHSKADCSTCP